MDERCFSVLRGASYGLEDAASPVRIRLAGCQDISGSEGGRSMRSCARRAGVDAPVASPFSGTSGLTGTATARPALALEARVEGLDAPGDREERPESPGEALRMSASRPPSTVATKGAPRRGAHCFGKIATGRGHVLQSFQSDGFAQESKTSRNPTVLLKSLKD